MGGEAALIRRLLVANRGEIAIRIARAARERGIVPLGVYSEADTGALHRRAMEAALSIGPAAARESYLDGERIIRAARALEADAIHPGYGFLSEQASFAQAVIEAGLIFVGPPPAAMAAVGSKIEARRHARALGIPVVPGYDGYDRSPQRLAAEARRIGFPVLIKASAGGGGRGMRVVTEAALFDEALAGAKREALAAFGDESVLLERAVARPRHVEVQILADRYGAVVHLGERECSVQRRHQKIVEESPSPAVDPALRARLGEAAVRFARDVGYENAGTVEFLLDRDGAFYFLEMNARLQVEHPVTELVYGVDLVGLQLDIASGKALPFEQDELTPRGWAVEVRLYAEDPAHDFLPSTGTIAEWEVPAWPGLRLDAGVERGSEVSIYYDALLAKIIAHSFEREPAIARLRSALESTHVAGVRTNLPLLARILADERFLAGDLSTGFIADERLIEALADVPDRAVLGAAARLLASGAAWRSGSVDLPLELIVGDRRASLRASKTGDGWRLTGDVEGLIADGALATTLGYAYGFAPPPSAEGGAHATHARAGAIEAPMPGKIVSVSATLGATVEAHALLVVLEAMKMEHRIEAPLAGTVREIFVEPGQLVGAGAKLVTVE